MVRELDRRFSGDRSFSVRNQFPDAWWDLQLADDELVRSWFRDGLIEDVALVLTLAGTTPAWP